MELAGVQVKWDLYSLSVSSKDYLSFAGSRRY